MIEFGKTLKAAREAKGLTTSQVAQETHIMVQIIEDMENDTFSRIPAPIYGRGFIKLYCNLVGIPPQPLLDEYMAITRGEHDVPIKTLNQSAPPPPQPTPTPTPTPQPTPPPPPTPPPTPPPQPTPTSQTTPPPTSFHLEGEPYVAPRNPPPQEPLADESPAAPKRATLEPGRFARYSSPALNPRPPEKNGFNLTLPKLPPNFTRLVIVIGGALLIFYLLIVSIRALYRLTMTPPENTRATSAAAESAEPARPSQPTQGEPTAPLPRTPGEVPPLYID